MKELIIAMLDEFVLFWQVVFPLLLSMDYLLPPQTFFAIIKFFAFTCCFNVVIPFVVLYILNLSLLEF